MSLKKRLFERGKADTTLLLGDLLYVCMDSEPQQFAGCLLQLQPTVSLKITGQGCTDWGNFANLGDGEARCLSLGSKTTHTYQ